VTTPPLLNVQPAARRASLYDLRWERRARDEELAALGRIRGSAEKWTATISALTGVLGLIVLIKGPEDITKAEGEWFGVSSQSWVGVLLAVAVACAIAAIMFAARAAQGAPTKMRPIGSELRRTALEEATTAAGHLDSSRWFAGFAPVFALGAIFLTWYTTPENPEAPNKVAAITDAGIAACGSLQGHEGANLLILPKGETEAVPVPVGSLRALTAVATCPGE
jgi:hypothetical protein